MFKGNPNTGLIDYSYNIDGKTIKAGNMNHISFKKFNYLRSMEKLIAKDFFEDNGWNMNNNEWRKS